MTKNNKIKKGVIIVAGRGTRFLPATKALPKEMLPILDKPVLQFIVEEMVDSGITEILFVTSAQKRPIEDHFDRDVALESFLETKGKKKDVEHLIKLAEKVRFFYTRQPIPLGSGHALLMAKPFLGDEPFVISDGDSIIESKTPATKQVINAFNKNTKSVIGVHKINDKKSMTKYGNVFAEPIKNQARTYKVKTITEKPEEEKTSPEGLIVGGMRYVFTKDIWPILEKQKSGRDGEVWLSDSANTLAKKGKLLAYEYEGQYFDTGNKVSMLNAILHFARKEGLLIDKDIKLQ